MSLVLGFKISNLKARARRHYINYDSILDGYSCGTKVAEHVSPDLLSHKLKFNATMEELEKIDPSCPKGKRL